MALNEPLNFSYSEVATYLMNTPLKEEISLDIGDNQSTLQDFKSSESAGYYCYKESNVWSSPCSNRFIYWRSNNDSVEFLEVSLDSNLVGNHIKIKFRNTAILDGISVHESGDKVIILLASVASIHRIALPHPKKLGCVVIDRSRANKSIVPHEPICLNADELLTRKSIFYDVTAETLRDIGTYHVLNSSFNISSSYSSQDMPFPVRSCSWLNHRNEACFALADCAGVISILTMVSPREGKVTRKDLKNTSIIKSIFYNLVPSVLSRTAQESEQAALHVLSHRNPLSFDDDLIIALCRDLRIRVWSHSDQECILTRSVMDIFQQSATSSQTAHTKSSKPTLLSPPVMKKVDQPFPGGALRMVVYLATQFGRRFILYNLGVSDESLDLSVHGSVVAPEDDLFDFVCTPSTIWALWQTQNDVSLTHWELEKKSQYWQNVTLYNEFQPITSVVIPTSGNCRPHFIDHIFRKGRFSMQTIIKTISTLSRSHESSYSKLSLEKLVIEAVKIVTNKIRQRSASSEMAPEIYNTFESELWKEFDSYCVQYHQVFNKPLSLMVDSRTGLAGILRVSSISFIRPNDALDHVLLSLHHPVNYIISNTLSDDSSLEGSIQVLLKGTKMIDNHLSPEARREFELGVISGEPLDQTAEDVIDNHIMINPDVWEKPGAGMVNLLEKITHEAPKLFEAIQVILNRFSLDRNNILEDEVDGLVPPGNAIDQFLVGTVGNCILAESMKQMCRLRYNFLRNLLLFQLLVLRSAQKRKIALNNAIEIRNTSIQKNIHHLQSYYSMLWLSEKCMALKQNSSLGIENTLSLLATLELNEYISLNRGGPLNLPFISDFSPKSVLAYIINHKKCVSVRKTLVQRLTNMEDLVNCHNWLSILPSLLHLIAEVIWPNSHSPHLMQFMLGYEQFDHLDEYARLLDSWSSFNSHSRQFIHGLNRCFSNKPKTSLPFFYSSLAGIRSEPFLQKIFMPNSPKEILEKPSNQFSNTEVNNFFNKLIRLCRLNALTSVIIDLATEAIQYLDPTEDNYNIHYSAFLTTLFMCHLENGDTGNAFQVMILNPSPIQRKDCLRQFTARLYENQAIEELISYSYGDMTDDFVSILEFRARSRDLLQTEKKVDFYDILYAYFIKENNYRKAATTTYEYAKRLGQEVSGIASLKKQAECLLLTINSLKLVDPKYAWIIRPVPKPITSSMSYSLPVRNGSATKRKHTSDEEDPESQANDMWVRREIQDLGIHEIRCEYVLINARYRLLEISPALNAVAATPLAAEETITLLISNLLFDMAFQLSFYYNLSYEPILEGLVGKYVYLTELPNRKINHEAGLREINECFIDNNTAALSFIARSDMLPIDKLLFLILAYVDKYEKPKQSQLHRCVAEKLLSSGIPLPAPLKLSYQKRNPPELLYLLMSYDYIEHAVTFAIEYTDGYLGRGSEFFNLEVPRVGDRSIVYYPHQHIKCLLKILETETADHKEYKELFNQLTEKYQQYQKLITTCTLARPS